MTAQIEPNLLTLSFSEWLCYTAWCKHDTIKTVFRTSRTLTKWAKRMGRNNKKIRSRRYRSSRYARCYPFKVEPVQNKRRWLGKFV
jgi:hypothetical protein